MKTDQIMDLKKSLLKDLLKQMDGGIASSLKPTKEELLLVTEESPDEEVDEKCDATETDDILSDETDESETRKKLHQLLSSM